MKPKWYFIPPLCAVGVLAAIYAGYAHRAAAIRAVEQAAQAEAATRAAEAERTEREAAARLAAAMLAERASIRAAEKAAEAAAQAVREEQRQALGVARQAIAAARLERERLVHQVAEVEADVRERAAHCAALETEAQFLVGYLSEAGDTLARLEALALALESPTDTAPRDPKQPAKAQ